MLPTLRPPRAAVLMTLVWMCALAVSSPPVASQSVVNPRVESVIIVGPGGRVDWHPTTGRVALDRMGADLNYDVYTMLPNGTEVRCLTCDKPVPQGHNGNPAWHPSGGVIAFQSLDPSLPFLPVEKAGLASILTSPGAGTNNTLWAMTSDGAQFWQLRTVAAGLGTLHPQFNRSGTRLLWSEKVQYSIGIDELWTMKLADLVWSDGTLRLANIIDVAPLGTGVFYETHGFSPDDSRILFTAGLLSTSATDIYTWEIATGTLQNLTNTPGEYDEHAHYAPNGTEIIWASSRGISIGRDHFVPYTDYWTMDVNGGNQQRLTYFNDPAYPEYIEGGAVAADVSYGPDQRWLIAKIEKNIQNPQFKVAELLAYIKRR